MGTKSPWQRLEPRGEQLLEVCLALVVKLTKDAVGKNKRSLIADLPDKEKFRKPQSQHQATLLTFGGKGSGILAIAEKSKVVTMRTSTRIAHDPIFSSFLHQSLGPLLLAFEQEVGLVGKVGFLFFRGKSGVAFRKQNGNLGKGVNSHFLNSKSGRNQGLLKSIELAIPTAFFEQGIALSQSPMIKLKD